MPLDVRLSDSRFRTTNDWLDSRHSFSYGPHYDPTDTQFGVLLAHNEDVVAPCSGFGTHPHRDLEIVTWVLSGALAHADSGGHRGVVVPGVVQRLSAGSGVLHSERNDGSSPVAPVHYVQMWVWPSQSGLAPSYASTDVTPALAGGTLVPLASGDPSRGSAVRIAQPAATLSVGRLPAGAELVLPVAPYVHLFVAAGTVVLEGAGELSLGDAVRVIGSDGRRVTARGAAEVLVWEMYEA